MQCRLLNTCSVRAHALLCPSATEIKLSSDYKFVSTQLTVPITGFISVIASNTWLLNNLCETCHICSVSHTRYVNSCGLWQLSRSIKILTFNSFFPLLWINTHCRICFKRYDTIFFCVILRFTHSLTLLFLLINFLLRSAKT